MISHTVILFNKLRVDYPSHFTLEYSLGMPDLYVMAHVTITAALARYTNGKTEFEYPNVATIKQLIRAFSEVVTFSCLQRLRTFGNGMKSRDGKTSGKCS